MKTITTQEHKQILDIRNEALSSLPPGIFEKDLLLTQALRLIAQTDSDGIQLVFCGGTCLSKAHRLIQRMSEDVDFKLVVPEGLSRTARSKRLSQFKKRLAQVLSDAGFLVPPEQIVARDENSYVALNLHYASRFRHPGRTPAQLRAITHPASLKPVREAVFCPLTSQVGLRPPTYGGMAHGAQSFVQVWEPHPRGDG